MPTKAVVRLCRATLLCLITLCRGLAAASIDSQHSAAPHTPQNSLLRRNATAAVPLFISPIMLYNQSGQRYQDGTAPRVARYFEEAVRSVRHSDSTVEVYLIVNFLPHPEDWDLLARLRVQVLSQTHTRGSGIVSSLTQRFLRACPISAGFAHATLLRYYDLLGALLSRGFEMIFFLEGDNLLLRPVSFLAQLYGISESRADDGELFDASPVHVSLHASFMSVDFVRAMVDVTTRLAEFGRARLGRCFLDGGGQDMRLTYEAAFELHRRRRLHGGGPARIINAAGGALPCRLVGRPFKDALTQHCSTNVLGPCAIHPIVTAFRASEGTLNASDLPLLYECAPDQPSWRPQTFSQRIDQLLNNAGRSAQIRGSIQLNLKGAANYQSPGRCSSPSCSGGRFGGTTTVSRVFACPAPWINPDQYNKQLVFHCGRVLSPVRVAGRAHRGSSAEDAWVEHFSLHFQGGSCKVQMRPTLSAVIRTRRYRQTLSCENATDRGMYERCLATGSGLAGASSECPDQRRALLTSPHIRFGPVAGRASRPR